MMDREEGRHMAALKKEYVVVDEDNNCDEDDNCDDNDDDCGDKDDKIT